MPSQNNATPAAPGPKQSPDIFISYSSADKKTADAICTSLEHAGLSCWIAPRNIAPGRDYGEAIIEGISQSRLIVLVLSRTANESQQVKREVERALNKNIPIIPFRIEDVPLSKALEYYLSTAHWLDAYTPPLSKHLKYLESTARSIIDGSEIDRSDLDKASGPWLGIRRRWLVIAVSMLVIAIAGLTIFLVMPRPRSLSYSLTVQRMTGDQKAGDEFQSTGSKDERYGNGWWYRMNVTADQSGYLYMLNEGTVNYNVLFPTGPNNDHLAANQTMQTSWYFFDENPGIERVWIIFSAQPLSELDTIFKDAAKNAGQQKLKNASLQMLTIMDSAQVKTLREIIARYPITESSVDRSKKQSIIKGTGDVLVSLMELRHTPQ